MARRRRLRVLPPGPFSRPAGKQDTQEESQEGRVEGNLVGRFEAGDIFITSLVEQWPNLGWRDGRLLLVRGCTSGRDKEAAALGRIVLE